MAERSEDKRTKALAEFYRKDFRAAEKYFTEAAIEDERAAEKYVLRTYQNWKDAGNSAVAYYRFDDGIEKYMRAQKWITKEQFPREWAEVRVLVGNARCALGTRTEGNKGNILLHEAKRDYKEALDVYTRTDLPQQWAMTQMNLGSALVDQGDAQPGSGPCKKSVG